MVKNITYGFHPELGVISRYGDSMAIWEIDYENMKPENCYTIEHKLLKISIFDLPSRYHDGIKWTKKIFPTVKNIHRKFWGLPLLKGFK